MSTDARLQSIQHLVAVASGAPLRESPGTSGTPLPLTSSTSRASSNCSLRERPLTRSLFTGAGPARLTHKDNTNNNIKGGQMAWARCLGAATSRSRRGWASHTTSPRSRPGHPNAVNFASFFWAREPRIAQLPLSPSTVHKVTCHLTFVH